MKAGSEHSKGRRKQNSGKRRAPTVDVDVDVDVAVALDVDVALA
jgi:hypothetical protein